MITAQQQQLSQSTAAGAAPMLARGADGHRMTVLPEGFQPGDKDFICGRGRAVLRHPGNVRFRNLVEQRLDEYNRARTKVEKSFILGDIVAQVRNDSPHGGFVKQSLEDGRWYEVGDFLARERTSQAFRDCLHSKYKSSSTTKTKTRRIKQLTSRANGSSPKTSPCTSPKRSLKKSPAAQAKPVASGQTAALDFASLNAAAAGNAVGLSALEASQQPFGQRHSLSLGIGGGQRWMGDQIPVESSSTAAFFQNMNGAGFSQNQFAGSSALEAELLQQQQAPAAVTPQQSLAGTAGSSNDFSTMSNLLALANTFQAGQQQQAATQDEILTRLLALANNGNNGIGAAAPVSSLESTQVFEV